MPDPFLREGVFHITPTSASEDAFRSHRHDVLNALQVIRAYIQMNRPESAIQSVDRLAAWLKSLGQWQNHIQGQTDGQAHYAGTGNAGETSIGPSSELIWVAARCPHVHFDAALYLPMHLSEDIIRELGACWDWLNTQCSERGISLMRICLRGTSRDPEATPGGIIVELVDTPDVRAWYESLDEEKRFSGTYVNMTLQS